jgi:hypothetical protein
MARRLLVGLLATGLLLVGAPAFAQPPVNETNVQKNLVETFVEALPTCQDGGPLYTITTTTNHVEHTTTFDDGRIHSTSTATGKLVAVPLEDPSRPSFTGSFTARGGLKQQNNEIVNGTFTFSGRGEGSDGSRFTFTPPSTSTSGRTARSMPSSAAARRLRNPDRQNVVYTEGPATASTCCSASWPRSGAASPTAPASPPWRVA